jgi:hypothetical protein
MHGANTVKRYISLMCAVLEVISYILWTIFVLIKSSHYITETLQVTEVRLAGTDLHFALILTSRRSFSLKQSNALYDIGGVVAELGFYVFQAP